MESDPITIPKRILSLSGKGIVCKTTIGRLRGDSSYKYSPYLLSTWHTLKIGMFSYSDDLYAVRTFAHLE
jgi:hypothetical protein